jgi:hypothetical protein
MSNNTGALERLQIGKEVIALKQEDLPYLRQQVLSSTNPSISKIVDLLYNSSDQDAFEFSIKNDITNLAEYLWRTNKSIRTNGNLDLTRRYAHFDLADYFSQTL